MTLRNVGSSTTPILLEGEVGYELDTDQYKLGDGEHAWNDLPYRGDPCLQQTGQSTTTPMSQKAVTDELNTINGKISAIASGAEVRLSLNVSCIYKNVATAVEFDTYEEAKAYVDANGLEYKQSE